MSRKVECLNKGMFSSMSQFELKQRPNGKTSLGTGSFGTVHLAMHTKTQQLYAIKSIQSCNIQTPYEQEGIEREIKVHFKSRHTNIVNLYDSFQENGTVYMVLEYVENGNLYNYVQKKKRLEEKEACKYFIQTCKALQYLHENNIFHRDIKPENLLLDSNHDIKLCDFGWCAENIHLKRKTFCGTYEYMAPEIVSDQAYDYTIDIWSVGVLLYELLHGYAPFKGKEYKDIQANIKSGIIKYSNSIQSDAQELIKGILQKDPNSRLTFKQIYQSAFVQRCYPQTLKINISPRSSFSMEQTSIQKYQSPLIHNKNLIQSRGLLSSQNHNPTNSSMSLRSPNVSKQKIEAKKSNNIFEDIKRKILFDQATSPLRDATNINRAKKQQQSSLNSLFKSSNTNLKMSMKSPENSSKKGGGHLGKFCSKSKNFDENSHSKLLDQFRSMPSITYEDQLFHCEEENHLKTDRVKGIKKDQQQDLDKLLKMYLSMCSSSRQ